MKATTLILFFVLNTTVNAQQVYTFDHLKSSIFNAIKIAGVPTDLRNDDRNLKLLSADNFSFDSRDKLSIDSLLRLGKGTVSIMWFYNALEYKIYGYAQYENDTGTTVYCRYDAHTRRFITAGVSSKSTLHLVGKMLASRNSCQVDDNIFLHITIENNFLMGVICPKEFSLFEDFQVLEAHFLSLVN